MIRNFPFLLMAFFVFVVSPGCSTQSGTSELEPGLRTTPADTFRVIQQGYENNSFQQVVDSLTEQTKRSMLFETVFAAGLVDGDTKAQVDNCFARYGLDIEAIEEASTNVEDFMARLVETIEDLDQFLYEANEILHAKSKPKMRPEILDVSIDGNRAILKYNTILYGYTKDGDGEVIENTSTHETLAYFRRKDANWLLCLEGEWKDPDFIWTVPK